jgi:hypothetical protein
MLFWGVHLGYPMHLLQLTQRTFLGYSVPVYYFLTIFIISAAAILALTLKRDWTAWEIAWWALPLICIPGILESDDRLWSTRQWLSWIVRGVIPGGIIFIAARRKSSLTSFLSWIYPVAIAAAVFGLWEIFFDRNIIWDGYWNALPQSQPGNPFYRPAAAIAISAPFEPPRGIQGNRLVYASTIVGFLPIALWLLKYKKKFYWANLPAVCIIFSLLLLSQVRTVWIATIVAITLILLLSHKHNKRENLALISGGFVCLAIFLALPKTSHMLRNRLNSFHLTNRSIHERLQFLQTAKVLKDYWLVGAGYGQFSAACKPSYPKGQYWNDTPDNQYLRWAIENGLPSLVLLFAFIAGIIRTGWEKIQHMEDPQEADLYKSLLIGLLSIAVTFMFFDGFYWGASNMTFWCFLGLFATCLKPTVACKI